MAEDMSAIKSSMEGMARSVEILTDRASNPTPTNWVGIGSLLLALVLAGGGFVALTTEPMQSDIHQLQLKDQANDDLHSKRGEIIGGSTEMIQDNKEEVVKLWREVSELRRDLLDIATNQAYNAARSEMMEEKVQAIDELGSRKWIGQKWGDE